MFSSGAFFAGLFCAAQREGQWADVGNEIAFVRFLFCTWKYMRVEKQNERSRSFMLLQHAIVRVVKRIISIRSLARPVSRSAWLLFALAFQILSVKRLFHVFNSFFSPDRLYSTLYFYFCFISFRARTLRIHPPAPLSQGHSQFVSAVRISTRTAAIHAPHLGDCRERRSLPTPRALFFIPSHVY